jgi:hypothetical protein
VVDRDLVPELLDDIDEADVDLRHLAHSRETGSLWPADSGRLGDRGCRAGGPPPNAIGRPRIGVAR